jgi:hypothetical protein
MNLLQKIAMVAAAIVLILSVMSLIRGELHDAAIGALVSACGFVTSGMLWPAKPRRKKN